MDQQRESKFSNAKSYYRKRVPLKAVRAVFPKDLETAEGGWKLAISSTCKVATVLHE